MKAHYLLILLLFASCVDREDDAPSNPISEFAACSSLDMCNDKTGAYCLFGLKWGTSNDFSSVGVEVEGPQIGGGTVSYSFQEATSTVSNHQQMDVPTKSFDQLPTCAKEKIRQAFEDWASVANIEFEELPEDSESDMKIFTASVLSQGNGFPNFTTSPCQQIAGHILLSPEYTSDCQTFYAYVLHEIGHSLGLGHSSGENLMGSINTNIEGLKQGDIEGIRQIYGE